MCDSAVAVIFPPSLQGDEKQRKERFVLSVAYSPDGRRLAAGSMDGTVAVFDVATGGLLHTLEGHFKPVRGLAFTPGWFQVPVQSSCRHYGKFP